jgi:hypothetical protein
MDDRTSADPLCTVCNEPVPDDGQRGSILAPGSGEHLDGAQILYHHRACERDGRMFLAEHAPVPEPVASPAASGAAGDQGTIRVAPAKPLSGSVRAGATITP